MNIVQSCTASSEALTDAMLVKNMQTFYQINTIIFTKHVSLKTTSDVTHNKSCKVIQTL